MSRGSRRTRPLGAARSPWRSQRCSPATRRCCTPASGTPLAMLRKETRQDRALLTVLQRHTDPQSWWLGYLDTGASDIVFWDAPKITLYWGWNYVLVRAGPQQAASWRPADGQHNWKSTELPGLMFPADRSWLVSTLSDDDWTCIGGPETLIADLLNDRQLARRARRVTADQKQLPRKRGMAEGRDHPPPDSSAPPITQRRPLRLRHPRTTGTRPTPSTTQLRGASPLGGRHKRRGGARGRPGGPRRGEAGLLRSRIRAERRRARPC
jgi:hypothetical protein